MKHRGSGEYRVQTWFCLKAGLTNFNPQETKKAVKDSPEGRTYEYTYRKGGVELN
jgi:hypothetical protein